MVFLPEKSTSFLPISFWFLPFLSLHLLPLSHPLVPYAPPVLKNSSLSGRKKVSSALLASSNQSKN